MELYRAVSSKEFDELHLQSIRPISAILKISPLFLAYLAQGLLFSLFAKLVNNTAGFRGDK